MLTGAAAFALLAAGFLLIALAFAATGLVIGLLTTLGFIDFGLVAFDALTTDLGLAGAFLDFVFIGVGFLLVVFLIAAGLCFLVAGLDLTATFLAFTVFLGNAFLTDDFFTVTRLAKPVLAGLALAFAFARPRDSPSALAFSFGFRLFF